MATRIQNGFLKSYKFITCKCRPCVHYVHERKGDYGGGNTSVHQKCVHTIVKKLFLSLHVLASIQSNFRFSVWFLRFCLGFSGNMATLVNDIRSKLYMNHRWPMLWLEELKTSLWTVRWMTCEEEVQAVPYCIDMWTCFCQDIMRKKNKWNEVKVVAHDSAWMRDIYIKWSFMCANQ